MDYKFLLAAAQAGHEAFLAVQAGQKWTGVRLVGVGIQNIGSFGETLDASVKLPQGAESLDPAFSFDRFMAENSGDSVKAAGAAFDFVKANLTPPSGVTPQGWEPGDFKKNRPVLYALLQAALKALLASVVI